MFKSDSILSRLMNLLFDILYVGVLWLICSLPVVTAGASMTAAYYAMAKCVRHKTGYIGREFFKAFKNNFRQIFFLNLLFLAVVCVLALDIAYVWTNESQINNTLFIVLVFLAFLVCGLTVYVCPVLSRFQKRNMELIKTAIYLMFKFLPVTVLIIVVFAACCAGICLMPWAILLIPGLYLYILSFPMEYILRKLMPVVEEDSEEAQKWYYQ